MLGGCKVRLTEDELRPDIVKEVFGPVMAIDRVKLRPGLWGIRLKRDSWQMAVVT